VEPVVDVVQPAPLLLEQILFLVLLVQGLVVGLMLVLHKLAPAVALELQTVRQYPRLVGRYPQQERLRHCL
jgi:hypothetical protein